MMARPTSPRGYSSFITMQLFEPLLELLRKLQEMPEQVPNEVQAGLVENGYAAALVVLAVTILESGTTRVQYLRGETENVKSAAQYFAKICQERQLCNQVEEIVVLRDSIVHSYVWEAQVYWDETGQLRFHSQPSRLPGFGKKRLHRVMDAEKRATKELELNLFPPRVLRRDAYMTLKVLERALQFLQEFESGFLPIHQMNWIYLHFPHTLEEIVASLVIPPFV